MQGSRLKNVGLAAVALSLFLFLTPAGAHISDSVSHLWTDHIKGKVTNLTYTKAATNRGFLSKTIKPGHTVRGVIGGAQTAAGTEEMAWSASLPGAAPVGLTDDKVSIDGVDESANECTGTSSNPKAAPGYVCVYPYSTFNADPNGGYIWGAGDGTKWGFQISIQSTGAGTVEYFGNWAYRAPR